MAIGITSLTELHSRLTPELPGCSLAVINQTLTDVVRDFCTLTEIWQVELTQNLVAAQVAYTLTPNVDLKADIRRIVDVTIEDMQYPLNVDLYEFNGNATLTLNENVTPVSNYTNGLVTNVVLAPKINSTVWDTPLMNRFSEAIVCGVKARLMDDDKQSYGNPRRAVGYAQDYKNATALAKAEVLRKFRTGSISVTSRSWL